MHHEMPLNRPPTLRQHLHSTGLSRLCLSVPSGVQLFEALEDKCTNDLFISIGPYEELRKDGESALFYLRNYA
jgi:hypothetical protein